MKLIFAALALVASAASAQTFQIPYNERVFISYNGDGSYPMTVAAPVYLGQPGYMELRTIQPYSYFYNQVIVSRKPNECVRVLMADQGYTLRQRALLCKDGDAWQDTGSPLKFSVSSYTPSGYTLTVSGLPKLVYTPPPPVTPKPGGTQ